MTDFFRSRFLLQLLPRGCALVAAGIFAFSFLLTDLQAQGIDPYRRMTNPRAIALLTGPDCQPLRHSSGYGSNGVIDSGDHHVVLACDSGSGIITHFWLTAAVTDSLTDFRIYVDDVLIVSSRFYEFFGLHTGMLRPPLDSTFPGGNVCDIQIPYRRNFKITLKSPSDNFYYAITWRPVSDSSQIVAFKLFPQAAEANQQQLAEQRFVSTNSLWSNDTATQTDLSGGILAHDTSTLFDLAGPALIQEIHLHPGTYDRNVLDSLIFQITWDEHPTPSVEVPVNDFFGAGTGAWTNESYWLRVLGGDGYKSFFPMPFANHARIRLINRGSSTIPFTGSIRYSLEPVDRQSQGYFCARFSESNPTRYAIFHPVLHQLGRGRYVGMNWSIPNNPSPVALEGDPFINIDSSPRNLIHYTGGEDYLNGGWWFFGATFTAPFSGFTHIFDSFYRFHVMDAIDFNSSIDYLLQHGVNNDVHDDYRTVAYYYLHWTPFWTDRDTISSGQSWSIKGVGYSAKSPVSIVLGSKNLWSVSADASGKFALAITVPSDLAPGSYALRVNGETKPEQIVVLARPSLRMIADSTPVTVRYGDTIALCGTGYQIGETISLFLDSIPVKSDGVIRVGSDYGFHATLHVPYLPDWKYHIVAVGSISGAVMLDQTITLTRKLNYEFEDLIPISGHSQGDMIYYNVSFYWNAHWSQQTYALFKPSAANGYALFKFYVPHDDSFAISFMATIGPKYGKYSISLDGRQIAYLDGYQANKYFDANPSDTLRGGVWFLVRDTHYIQWSCLGKADSAKEQWLGADNFILNPTTHLPPAPGTFTGPQRYIESLASGPSQFIIFPDPCATSELSLRLSIGQSDSQYARASVNVDIFDVLGRNVRSLALPSLMAAESTIKIGVENLLPGTYFCKVHLTQNANLLERIIPFLKVR